MPIDFELRLRFSNRARFGLRTDGRRTLATSFARFAERCARLSFGRADELRRLDLSFDDLAKV